MAQNVVNYSGSPSGANLLDVLLTGEQQNRLTSNSGTSRPSFAVAGTMWLDTTSTPWVMKLFDGTDDIPLGTFNATTNVFRASGADALTVFYDNTTSGLTATNVKAAIDELKASPLADGAVSTSAKLADFVVSYFKLASSALATTAEVIAGTASKLVNAVELKAALPSMIPFTGTEYTSAEQTITNAGTFTLTHGLGAKPKLVTAYLVCKTAELDYSVNDEVMINIGAGCFGSTTDLGMGVTLPNATTIHVRIGASGFRLPHKTTGVGTGITNGNWRLVLKAYK